MSEWEQLAQTLLALNMQLHFTPTGVTVNEEGNKTYLALLVLLAQVNMRYGTAFSCWITPYGATIGVDQPSS